nr:MAG TPA: hypothetical protein [Bacteriophage sp.]
MNSLLYLVIEYTYHNSKLLKLLKISEYIHELRLQM